ncbi:MAG: hypothetical protein IJ555_14270 [Ruminococcus sp.]|nr:hypothetical protein [Ruminococcus sp.]
MEQENSRSKIEQMPSRHLLFSFYTVGTMLSIGIPLRVYPLLMKLSISWESLNAVTVPAFFLIMKSAV